MQDVRFDPVPVAPRIVPRGTAVRRRFRNHPWGRDDGTGNAGVVTFQPIDANRTRITLDLDVEPQDWVEKIGDKLGFVSKQSEGDLKRFKDFIESRGRETGAWRGDV